MFSEFLGERAGNVTARNNLQKQNFVVLVSTYAIKNISSMDVLSNESERIVLPFACNAIGRESLANFGVK
jgi:hypothetical protein